MKFNFQNYEDYKAQRSALCDEADALLTEGNVDAANEKMADSGGFGNAIIWIIVLAAAGGLGFVWLSRGSFKIRR